MRLEDVGLPFGGHAGLSHACALNVSPLPILLQLEVSSLWASREAILRNHLCFLSFRLTANVPPVTSPSDSYSGLMIGGSSLYIKETCLRKVIYFTVWGFCVDKQ